MWSGKFGFAEVDARREASMTKPDTGANPVHAATADAAPGVA